MSEKRKKSDFDSTTESQAEDELWDHSQSLELSFQTSSPHYAKKANEIDMQYIENWQQSLKEILVQNFNVKYNLLQDKDIIEVGCGARGDINVVPGSGRRVGIDPLMDEFQRHEISYRANNVELYSQRGEAIQFSDNSFDIAFCFNVLDHVQNVKNVLAEIFRVLRPNGQMLLSVHIYEYFSAMTPSWILRRLDPPHPHHFSHKQVMKEIISAGFLLTDSKLTPLKLPYSNFLLRIVARVVGRSLWLVATKPAH